MILSFTHALTEESRFSELFIFNCVHCRGVCLCVFVYVGGREKQIGVLFFPPFYKNIPMEFCYAILGRLHKVNSLSLFGIQKLNLGGSVFLIGSVQPQLVLTVLVSSLCCAVHFYLTPEMASVWIGESICAVDTLLGFKLLHTHIPLTTDALPAGVKIPLF